MTDVLSADELAAVKRDVDKYDLLEAEIAHSLLATIASQEEISAMALAACYGRIDELKAIIAARDARIAELEAALACGKAAELLITAPGGLNDACNDVMLDNHQLRIDLKRCQDAAAKADPNTYRYEIDGISHPDAIFIAAARTDVPALVAALRLAIEGHHKTMNNAMEYGYLDRHFGTQHLTDYDAELAAILEGNDD